MGTGKHIQDFTEDQAKAGPDGASNGSPAHPQNDDPPFPDIQLKDACESYHWDILVPFFLLLLCRLFLSLREHGDLPLNTQLKGEGEGGSGSE